MEFERITDTKRVAFIIDALRQIVVPGGDIIDIGCGNGIITRAIGELGYRVLGIDVSEKAIAAAGAANTLPNVHFRVQPAFLAGDTAYDAVVCSEVLEHLPHPEELLCQVHASLKPGGVLIVTVPNGSGPRERLVTRPVQRLQQSNGLLWRLLAGMKRLMGYSGTTVQSSADDLTHLQFFTRRSLSNLASATGFRITRLQATNFIEQVFPFSLVARRSAALQRLDCRLADRLPLSWTSGFMSVWTKV